MNRAATRSRWLELKRSQAAAVRGRELLDRKREVLVREILRVRGRREAKEREMAVGLSKARRAMANAEVEIGTNTIDSAALAQPPRAWIEIEDQTLLGVSLPKLSGRFETFRIRYAPGGTAVSLDYAAEAFAAVTPLLISLAEEELGLENLRRALARTNRRWNALDRILLPSLTREIREVESAIEEESRDDAVRSRRRARLIRSEADKERKLLASPDEMHSF